LDDEIGISLEEMKEVWQNQTWRQNMKEFLEEKKLQISQEEGSGGEGGEGKGKEKVRDGGKGKEKVEEKEETLQSLIKKMKGFISQFERKLEEAQQEKIQIMREMEQKFEELKEEMKTSQEIEGKKAKKRRLSELNSDTESGSLVGAVGVEDATVIEGSPKESSPKRNRTNDDNRDSDQIQDRETEAEKKNGGAPSTND